MDVYRIGGRRVFLRSDQGQRRVQGNGILGTPSIDDTGKPVELR